MEGMLKRKAEEQAADQCHWGRKKPTGGEDDSDKESVSGHK